MTGPAQGAETDCKSISDPAARFRCFDEYAVSIISRAKAAARRELYEPTIAVFYNMQIKANGQHVCGQLDLERNGISTGLRNFAYDGQRAYVLLRNAADGISHDKPAAERLEALEEAIGGYDRICGVTLQQCRAVLIVSIQ